MKKFYTILLFVLLISNIKTSAQCTTGLTYSAPTNTTYAFKTAQSFTPTCSGQLTNITFTIPNLSDDLRSTGYYVRCNFKTIGGALLAIGIMPTGKDTTEVWYGGLTVNVSFNCGNVSLQSGTQYVWELEALTTIQPPTQLILFTYKNGNPYAGGSYMAEGVVPNAAWDIQGWQVNIANGSIAATSATKTQNITPCTAFYNAVPELVCNVKAGNTNGISGSTTSKVWIETTQPASYVKRHYEITPATNAATATGRVTLYFTQAEFDAFNTVNTLKLPANASDAIGKANLRVEKRGGSSSNGTGLPHTYIGSVTNIDPADADIVWNSALNRWEISFDVTGFSGFFVKTNPSLLPLQWLKVNASLNINGYAQLAWQVEEKEVQAYTIERSADNRNFISAGELNSKGNGTNSYLFTEAKSLKGTAFYRIKQSGRDGKFSYSETLRLSGNGSVLLSLYPNPFTSSINVQSNVMQTAKLSDASGRLVQTLTLKPGVNNITTDRWSKGIYTLQTQNGETVKLIKE